MFAIADSELTSLYLQRQLESKNAEEEADRKKAVETAEREQHDKDMELLFGHTTKPEKQETGYGLGMTSEGYQFLKNGMARWEVSMILECPGVEQSRAGNLATYVWRKAFANIVTTFEDDKLVAKAQSGL